VPVRARSTVSPERDADLARRKTGHGLLTRTPRHILLPHLAESVVEGEIQKWLVAEGDTIAKDQPIVEVTTDKATVELPSPFSGVLLERLVQEGQIVRVDAPIALMREEGERPDTAAEPEPLAAASDASLFKPSEDREVVKNPFGQHRVRATPAARKIARELGVELSHVSGSGTLGRVRTNDVTAAAERRTHAVADTVTMTFPVPAPVAYRTPSGYEQLEERIPLRGIRRAMAQQMMASHLNTVRTLVVDEADVTALGAVRARLKPRAEAQGVKLTYLPFVFRAL